MRITSLTLHGFKSFGNRTTIEFSPAITAVVGPNGSGKSNIIDALKWASGGGRASEFRAGEKTELIFHGAAGKKSLGYAEVEVELRGEGRRLAIFRSLHRDGTGRLKLNGKASRFLDIDEELAGSGLGRSGLAIIGQGEVSGVLMADPARLLGYVAEVAGVARLAGRREQTEERLTTAQGHLARLDDLMLELGRQIARLEGEAGAARRHVELTRESLQLRYTIARLREESLRSEIRAIREDRDGLSQEILEAGSELEGLRNGVDTARGRREEAERTYREALAATEARRGDVRVAEARSEAAERRLADVRRQARGVEGELEGLAELREPKLPEGQDMSRLAATEESRRNEVEEALQVRRRAEQAAAEARERVEAARQKLSESGRRRAALESRRAALETEIAELEASRHELSKTGGSQEEVDLLTARVAELDGEQRKRESRLEVLRESLAKAQNDHARALAEAQALARAAERSRHAFEARRGYADGPRHALASGIEGVLGSVADLLRVPERYREAVAAALGRRVEYVVVEDSGVGRRVLEFVRGRSGHVTVLPLDLVQGREGGGADRLLTLPGVVGAADRLVESDARFRGIVRQLLGGTVVVEDMEVAVGIARRERSRPRLVTLDGNVIESYGAMSGGRRQSGAGVLGAAAELEAAEEAADRAAAEAEGLEESLKALQLEARELISATREAKARLDSSRAELSRLRESAAGRRELEADLERRLERARTEHAGLPAPVADEGDSDLDARRREQQDREEELAGARDRVEQAQAALAEASRVLALAHEQERAYRLARERFDRDVERREALATRLEGLYGEIAVAEEQLARAREALAQARAALPNDLTAKQEALELSRQSLREAEARLERHQSQQASRAEALERLNVTLARREAGWEAAAEDLRGFPEGVATVDGSERALRARLGEVSGELEALGPVNHRAALELEEESRRLEEIGKESQEAARAIEELAATLAELDRETTSRLEAGVLGLREGFVRHVRELFGDSAEADIEVDREEGRPVGLRIRLQPPGKQTRQLNLLSVGERTMGAMAFLFALMSEGEGQGLPIAILDEVDAPLDEANIRRYCDFLSRLANRGTQFVLITHQKATFDVADSIWGVTTEAGVSRVFSISRNEAMPVA